MKKRRVLSAMLIALCVVCLMGGSFNVQAQAADTAQAPAKQPETKDDEINLDTQLFLIVGTNQDVVDSKLPPSLDSVVKQLRASLPFKNYRLAATLLNRVKNEGRLDVTWIGGPLSATANSPTLTPNFSNFFIRQIRLVRASDGQQMVQMQGFNFGARVPIQTGQAVASNSPGTFPTGGFPTINYERTGVATDISMREAEPVIVGTLTVGTSGDVIILVVSAKRTQK